MKIVYRNVDNAYNDLTKMLNNQLDILDELDQAINDFVSLEDFTGTAAEHIKSYINETHCEVIKTLKALIYFIDITMYYSNQDFESSIDTEYSPIYESEYIQDIIDKVKTQRDNFTSASSTLTDIRNSVSDIVSLDVDFCYDEIENLFSDSITYAMTAKSDFEQFNFTHSTDFTETEEAMTNLSSILSRMTELGNVEHIGSYEPGTIDADESMQKLRDYQLSVGDQIEQNGWDSTFEYLETYSEIRTIESLIESGYDIGVGIDELRSMYKAGIKFSLETSEDTGKVVFKIISNYTSAGEVQAALRQIGAGSIKYSKIQELIGDGLQVVDDSGNVVNKNTLKRLLKSDAAQDILKYADGIKKYTGGESGVLKISKDVLDVFDISLTVGTDIYDNIYNPTTGQFMQDFDGKDTCDTITDLAVDLGSDIGLEAAGGAIGTLICPGIGTAIGAGVGAIADIIVTWELGEPPESIADYVKDGISDISGSIGDWFSTVFW